jgi:protein-S-isoprenylcysteine O-methyltransferase Ste14
VGAASDLFRDFGRGDGSAVVAGDYRALLAVLLVWVGLTMKARREEKLLSEQFGDAFVQYRQRTGALVPKF